MMDIYEELTFAYLVGAMCGMTLEMLLREMLYKSFYQPIYYTIAGGVHFANKGEMKNDN